MEKKHSCLNMGNELNGFGEKKYFKASEIGYHTPLSQKNVRISPDYTDCLHKVVGSMPKWINPLVADDLVKAITGATAVVNQVIVDKNKEGTNYITKINFIGSGITNGSFSHYRASSKNNKPKWTNYFCIITEGNMNIRKEIPQGDILAKVQSGGAFQVNEAETDYDESNKEWVWVKYKDNKGVTTEGWSSKEYMRPDKVRTITFPESTYKDIKGTVEYKSGKTDSSTKNTITGWGQPGKGTYPKNNKVGNYYVVAVPPKIIIEDYPDKGKMFEQDFRAYSKYIKVYLKLKNEFKNTNKADQKTIECVIGDMKAHSYSKYPYDDESRNGSTTVNSSEVKIGNGLVQTGIKYPYVDETANEAYVKFNTFNANIIEFCSQEVDFEVDHYYLDKVETNYEIKSRGTDYGKWLKQLRGK